MKFWESLPKFFHERTAACCADAIHDYFRVRCRVRSRMTGRSLLYEVSIPDDVGAELREVIEGFIVAYGCGWETGASLAKQSSDELTRHRVGS